MAAGSVYQRGISGIFSRISRSLRRRCIYKSKKCEGITTGTSKVIRTIRFEARPVGDSKETAELLAGEKSNDYNRWKQYPAMLLMLNRYAVLVAKEAAAKAVRIFSEQELLSQEALIKLLREKMKEAARQSNLSARRAVLFSKRSPMIAKMGSSVTEDLLLYKGYASYFDKYLNEVVCKMTGARKADLPYRLAEQMSRGISEETFFLEFGIMLQKPAYTQRAEEGQKELPIKELLCILREIRTEDCKAVYLRSAYAKQYGIGVMESSTVSGSVLVKDHPAAGLLKKELEQWAKWMQEDPSCGIIANFAKWLERFDDKIVLASWLAEVLFLTQDIESDRCCRTHDSKGGIYRMTFDRPSMLRSLDFDLFMQGKSCACLLERDGNYYLLMLNPKLRCTLDEDAWGSGYRVLTYKQACHPERSFPRLFVQDKYHPDPQLVEMVQNKTYLQTSARRRKWIEHCIKCLSETPDYMRYQLQLKEPQEYANLRDFYRDVERQTIYMGYDHELRPDYVQDMIERKEACLFELYCMDFSRHHHGKMGRNAQILVTALSDENMRKIAGGVQGGIRILGGTCRIYTREKQLEPIRYPAGTPFLCKNGNVRRLPYDVTKKKRYTQRKYLFAMSVEMKEE